MSDREGDSENEEKLSDPLELLDPYAVTTCENGGHIPELTESINTSNTIIKEEIDDSVFEDEYQLHVLQCKGEPDETTDHNTPARSSDEEGSSGETHLSDDELHPKAIRVLNRDEINNKQGELEEENDSTNADSKSHLPGLSDKNICTKTTDLEASRSSAVGNVASVKYEDIGEDEKESTDEEYIPEDVMNNASDAESILIPEKSKTVYERHYKNFKNFLKSKNIKSINETILLGYFNILKKGVPSDHTQLKKISHTKTGMAPNSLWAVYSMLKCTLSVYDKIDIGGFQKLTSFLSANAKLSKQSRKKTKLFTDQQITKFLDKAPDQDYLAMKVAVIFGMHGLCRRRDLYELTPENLQDHGTSITFKMEKTKNRSKRPFAITGNFCNLVKKYMALRPADYTGKPNFFLRQEDIKKERKREENRRYRKLNRESLKYRHKLYRLRKRQQPVDSVSNNLCDGEKKAHKKMMNHEYHKLHKERINRRKKDYREQRRNPQTPNVKEQSDSVPYSNYTEDQLAHKFFVDNFDNNSFGYACSICDRLWFENDLRNASRIHEKIITNITTITDITAARLCPPCKYSLDRGRIPSFSVYNGFHYPIIPPELPKLDFLTERLISPRIPFVQIRRLGHIPGQFGVYARIINVPVSTDTVVQAIPRNLNEEHCLYVHIKNKMIHNTGSVHGLGRLRPMEMWLRHLITTPLYRHYKININQSFLNQTIPRITLENIDEVSEVIPVEDSYTAQQETLLWNELKYLFLATDQHNQTQHMLFQGYSEELSFPSIYAGINRRFKNAHQVTPFMIASSEILRRDRRGVTPYHLLYMAVKTMRLRVHYYLNTALKNIGTIPNVTRKQLKSEVYINELMELSLGFLKPIPNTIWYWAEQRKDLLAMIRQLGKPHALMSLHSNEIEWTNLLALLSKLAEGKDASEQTDVSKLSLVEKNTLINKDAVTCLVYFNKLVNVIMEMLTSSRLSPFGNYRVNNYFQRIEFQSGGSTHAHIFLWLDNGPEDMFVDVKDTINMIDSLVSVGNSEASGHINRQRHKHSDRCCTESGSNECRLQAPFMPASATMILQPMNQADVNYPHYSRRYREIKSNLEVQDYSSMDDYYAQNNIESEEDYECILSAGIERPTVFYKREPSEKWHNAFNPFVLNVLKSSMDLRIILDEYTCAEYIVDYVSKTKGEVSELQQKMTQVIDTSNSTEMTSQEAAWYLLAEPLTKSSIDIHYINTYRSNERSRIAKTRKTVTAEKSDVDDSRLDIWRTDWHFRYERRHKKLERISLAQFVSQYSKSKSTEVVSGQKQIIRYRNYDVHVNCNEFKREMVTLHLPFRDENDDILADMKYVKMYDKYEEIIHQRRQAFESNVDIRNIENICRTLGREY